MLLKAVYVPRVSSLAHAARVCTVMHSERAVWRCCSRSGDFSYYLAMKAFTCWNTLAARSRESRIILSGNEMSDEFRKEGLSMLLSALPPSVYDAHRTVTIGALFR